VLDKAQYIAWCAPATRGMLLLVCYSTVAVCSIKHTVKSQLLHLLLHLQHLSLVVRALRALA